MKNFMGMVVLGLVIPIAAICDAELSSPAPPAWFLEEIATLTAHGGVWVADNAEYQSDDEPYDSYGTEWKSSFDGTTMTGVLYGIQNGEKTSNFWEFREYWHPQKGEAIVEQFGWGGVVGIGTAWKDGEAMRSRQFFYTIDGTVSETGHTSTFADEFTHVTESFDIEDDSWAPRRKYTWRLSRPVPAPGSTVEESL